MFKSTSAILILMLCYLCFWPVPINPITWSPQLAPKYVGAFAKNNTLANIEQISIGTHYGPEDIVSDRHGNLYTSTHSGWILKKAPSQQAFMPWVDTKGRPLGMDFDASGHLIVADAFLGLLSVSPQGEITILTNQVDGSPIRYADDVDIAPNGKIYFSDASVRFGAKENGGTYPASLLDIMEHSRSGRVLEYSPKTMNTRVVMDKLSFANGIAMSPNGQFILINETSEYRIHKFWLAGDKAGTSQILIDNLPGFPDNISTGQDGRFWFGLASPRLKIVDALADKPWLRKVAQRLPQFLRPKAGHYSHVVAIDSDGNILASLQDPSGAYPVTTGVLETDDYLYISSLTAATAARLPKPAM